MVTNIPIYGCQYTQIWLFKLLLTVPVTLSDWPNFRITSCNQYLHAIQYTVIIPITSSHVNKLLQIKGILSMQRYNRGYLSNSLEYCGPDNALLVTMHPAILDYDIAFYRE